ncbi:hypothetical protein BGZ96_002410 [Linnemannia gamsii]|uniref:Ubiquitin-like domain-containing protein n=1 Tax=Linnemannia gamsii TaxID=64522 RepID=A0ABQ7JKS2_9FUNG|nr:hypothetical protein BGZ96_002410 [Linnemannia gamsii]
MVATLDIVIAKGGPNDTIKVSYKLDGPIFFLLKRIHDTLGTDDTTIECQDLFLNGMHLNNNFYQTMEYYSILGHTVTYRAIPSPVAGKEEITVYAITYVGKHIKLTCRPGMLVYDVKQLVQDNGGRASGALRFIFANKELENERTLSFYDIQHSSALLMLSKFYGGGTVPGIVFADVSDTSGTRKVHFSKDVPSRSYRQSWHQHQGRLCEKVRNFGGLPNDIHMPELRRVG